VISGQARFAFMKADAKSDRCVESGFAPGGFLSPLDLSSRFAPRSVFQQLCVHRLWRELDVSDDRTTDEAVLHGHHVRMPGFIENFDVIQTNVEELVDRLQYTRDREVVLELNGDLLVREGFEH